MLEDKFHSIKIFQQSPFIVPPHPPNLTKPLL